MTRPPLLATPGGVISRHLAVPAGRANSCQKLLWLAADPPISATAQVPVAVTREVASDALGAGLAAAPVWCVAVPQPAVTAAAASTDTTLARRLTPASDTAGRRRRAGPRT